MSKDCIKTKQFLFWKYKVVEHDFKIDYADKFAEFSRTYHVHYECEKCKLTIVEKFVENDAMLLLGFSQEDINKLHLSSNVFESIKPINP